MQQVVRSKRTFSLVKDMSTVLAGLKTRWLRTTRSRTIILIIGWGLLDLAQLRRSDMLTLVGTKAAINKVRESFYLTIVLTLSLGA